MFAFAPRTSYLTPYDTTAPDSIDTLETIAINQAKHAFNAGLISFGDYVQFRLSLG